MSARRSLLFVFVLFVLLVFVGLREWQSIKRDVAPVAAEAGAATEPVTSSEPPIEYRDQRPQSIFDVQPAAMPEALRSWYRLRPDRRVLLAVSVLHSLTTGEPEPTLVVDFREGRWRLSQNGKDVGELPELASFEDGWRMLAGIAATAPLHASARAKDVTALQSALDDYSVRRLADALGKAGEQWRAGARTEDVLRIAVHGLLGLVLQGHDPLEQNDMLLARALAATVLLDRLGADTGRERALLADQFGYTREAGSIAMPLAAEDPVRAFVLREHATLRTLAEHPDASRFVRHLYLMRLADYRDIRGWSDWVAEHIGGTPFDLGLFRSAFMVQDFAGDRALSHQAPYLVLLETWRAAHPNGIAARVLRRAVDETDPGFAMAFGTAVTHGQPARLLDEFEAMLPRVGRRQSGPFLDSLAYRDYFRGYMYGAFYTYSSFVIDKLSSVPATEDLVAALDSAPSGLGTEVAHWNRALLTSMQGPENVDELLVTLAERRVGSNALDRVFDEVTERAGWTDPRVLEAARRLSVRLDARPANVARFALVAYSQLMDMRLAGELFTHLERIAGDTRPSAVIWLQRMRGDVAGIRRLAEDRALERSTRSYALTILAGMDAAAAADVHAAFDRMIGEDPRDWGIRRHYIEYLEKRDDNVRAARVADDWLAHNEHSDGFDEIYARTALARSLELRGMPDSAWIVIGPAVQSGQGGAMARAASILARLRDAEAAVRTARAAADRYPHAPYTHAKLAEVHWLLGDYAAAAAALRDAAPRLKSRDWSSTVGESLYRALGDRAPSETARATEALLAAGVEIYGNYLWLEFARRKQFAHAFEISSRVSSSNSVQDIGLKTAAYRHLRHVRGEPAARAWLDAGVPHELRTHASMFFYDDGEWSLLWDLVPEPERGPYTSVVWLYRAAAAVQEGFATHPRRAELLAYYARESADPYDVMGRHLVGLAGEAELLAVATAPDRLCEVAYYLGLRAAADGRYAAASDWLRVVRETGLSREGEYSWAMDLLGKWRSAGELTRFRE